TIRSRSAPTSRCLEQTLITGSTTKRPPDTGGRFVAPLRHPGLASQVTPTETPRVATRQKPIDDTRDVELLDQLARARAMLIEQIARRIVGQHKIVDDLVAALLAGGHVLLVGVPGLAKTLLVQTVSQALDLSFSRVQFTPDLMPSDITGTELLEEDHTTGKR